MLACSHERLPCTPAQWAHDILDRHPQCQTVLIGMGHEGCLLAVRDQLACHIPAAAPGPVINTTGAGDALLAAYLHATHTAGHEPTSAAEHAVLFAGHTITSTAPEQRYLTSPELDDLHAGIATELHPTSRTTRTPNNEPPPKYYVPAPTQGISGRPQRIRR